MGRGRAKAKQTKVARRLKYQSLETDFDALQRELGGDGSVEAEVDQDDEADGYDFDETDEQRRAGADRRAFAARPKRRQTDHRSRSGRLADPVRRCRRQPRSRRRPRPSPRAVSARPLAASASARATRATMPTPMLSVRSSSPCSTPPGEPSRPKTGCGDQVERSILAVTPGGSTAGKVRSDATAGHMRQRVHVDSFRPGQRQACGA